MKASILTSFVTLALSSAHSFANAVPPESAKVSDTTRQDSISSPSHKDFLATSPRSPRRLPFPSKSGVSRSNSITREAMGSIPLKSAVVPNSYSTIPERGLANRTLSRAGRRRDTPRTNNSRTLGHEYRRSTHAILNSADRQPALDITSRGILANLLQNIAEQQATSTGNVNRRIQNDIVRTRREVDDDLLDIQYLNFALILEQFQYAFYSHALSIFSDDDFNNAGYPSWVRGRFQEIFSNGRVHKEFLESAIAAAGSEHVQPANYDFHHNNVHSFIDTSVAIETIATSAYLETLQSFNNKAYITAGASILANRACQAAWINSSVRKQNPWGTPFHTPLTLNQVLTLLTVFFNFDTSPQLNRSLLPANVRPYPRLTLSPHLAPGEEAEISFPYSSPTNDDPEFLYVAFLSGAETIFGRVHERERPTVSGGEPTPSRRRYFVGIPGDLASKGVVYVIVVKGSSEKIRDVRLDDDGVVAGPAIAMFPFNAKGKAI